MTTKKLSELTELTSVATNDLLFINDVSVADADKSKKITVANLVKPYDDAIWAVLHVKYSTVVVLGPGAPCSVGDGKLKIPIPASMNGWKLTGVKGFLSTAGTTGTMTVQIENLTAAADVLSTKLTFASGAVVDNGTVVIDTDHDDVSTGNILSFNIDTIHTTAAIGLVLELKWEPA